VWLPPHLPLAHYRACDALRLPATDQIEIGRQVGSKIQGTFLGTLAAVAKQAGASPWSFLGQFNRLFERLAVGGGVSVLRLGPKESVIEIHRVPIFQVSYFATAWRGVMQGLCELFSTRTYVKLGHVEPEKASYSISWA
jgi:AraC-like DNA-binding protein